MALRRTSAFSIALSRISFCRSSLGKRLLPASALIGRSSKSIKSKYFILTPPYSSFDCKYAKYIQETAARTSIIYAGHPRNMSINTHSFKLCLKAASTPTAFYCIRIIKLEATFRNIRIIIQCSTF